MRAFASISIILVLATGCELLGPERMLVEVRTDKRIYSYEPVTAVVANLGSRSVILEMPHCGFDGLFRMDDGTWSPVVRPIICPAIPPRRNRIEPGGEKVITSPAPGGGVYRFQFRIWDEDGNLLPESYRTSRLISIHILTR